MSAKSQSRSPSFKRTRDWFLTQRVSPRIALLSQFSSLGATAALNLGLLLVGSEELVQFARITAPALLTIGLFDFGLNQRFQLDNAVRPYLISKALLAFAAVVAVLVVGSGSMTPLEVSVGVLYAVSFVGVTTCIGFYWRLNLFRLDAASTIVQAMGVLSCSLIGFRTTGSALGLVAGQAAFNALFFMVIAVGVAVLYHASGTPAVTRLPENPFKALLMRAASGAALNTLSNGVFTVATLATSNIDLLAKIRIVSLAAVGTYALVPVAPQHFARMKALTQSRYLNGLRIMLSISVGSMLVGATMPPAKVWFFVVASGVSWGLCVSIFMLIVNARFISLHVVGPTLLFSSGLLGAALIWAKNPSADWPAFLAVFLMQVACLIVSKLNRPRLDAVAA